MEITVKSQVHPTEDAGKVREAIENLLGKGTFDIEDHENFSEIVVPVITQEGLNFIRRLIQEKRIIDAVRVRLLGNFNDLELTTGLDFDKQAAFIGKIRLIDNTVESPPLGAVEIRMTFKDLPQFREFLDWFSPRTKDGKVFG
jgi:predicted RNA binding protein with dsRBD fold (UPF0201 family)